MYSDKAHINYLTQVLQALGITDIVACPGARNAPLCHNFYQAGFTLHPVTDERSAAFVAIGIYLETKRPIVVCVTSGTAILNTLPAVAEAFYRHIPLIVLSADRPKAWIGQLDGQTLPQQNALHPYAPCLNIHESSTLKDIEDGIKNTLSATHPSHVNIELEEPLFHFNKAILSDCNIDKYNLANNFSDCKKSVLQKVADAINNAKFPLLIMGQQEEFAPELFDALSTRIALLPEIISNARGAELSDKLEKLLTSKKALQASPDLVVHIGGAFICKQVKLYLRKLSSTKIIRIGLEDTPPKTFGSMDFSVQNDSITFLRELLPMLPERDCHMRWTAQINELFSTLPSAPITLEEQAIIAFEESMRAHGISALHLANSSSVRWANSRIESGRYPVFCNRGVNGIEGSLSTAAGHALATDKLVGCIIGDLSFFYDANALWNTQLKGNLIILLLNNSKGKIFYKLGGLKDSPALEHFIAAQHQATAEGICSSYSINHRYISNYEAINQCISKHIESRNNRPLVLEFICN